MLVMGSTGHWELLGQSAMLRETVSDLPIFNKEHSQMTNYCIPQCLSQEGKALVL